jgi:hypothetical protein
MMRRRLPKSLKKQLKKRTLLLRKQRKMQRMPMMKS